MHGNCKPMLPRTWIVAVRERSTSYPAERGTLGVGFFGSLGRNEIRLFGMWNGVERSTSYVRTLKNMISVSILLSFRLCFGTLHYHVPDREPPTFGIVRSRSQFVRGVRIVVTLSWSSEELK